MRIFIYVVRQVAARSCLLLLLFVFIYTVIDIVEVDIAKRPLGASLLAFYFFKLPYVGLSMMPLAIAVGALLTVHSLFKHGEWDALHAAGIRSAPILIALLAVPGLAMIVAAATLIDLAPHGLRMWARHLEPRGVLNQKVKPIWCLKGNTLLRWDERSGLPELTIERDRNGQPQSVRVWRFPERGGSLIWRRNEGWNEEPLTAPMSKGCEAQAVFEAKNAVLWPGAELTARELLELSSVAAQQGLASSPFRAELALRAALAGACLVVPLVALSLGLLWRRLRSWHLVGIGVGVAALFWFLLSASWQGAAVGAWSPWWVGAGIPLLFLLGGSILMVMSSGR